MRTTPQSWTHPRLARDSSRDRRVNALQSDVRSGPRRAAIIGCGVVGLSTARLLQRRGWQVTIYARDLPPNTTSNVAIGQWAPSSVFEEDALAPGFIDQFKRASLLASSLIEGRIESVELKLRNVKRWDRAPTLRAAQ